MRKIKILHKVLMAINCIALVAILSTLFLYYNILDNNSEFRQYIPNQFEFWISTLNALIWIFGLYVIQRSLFNMYSIDYFNSKATKYMKIGGIILILNSIITFVLELTNEETFHRIPSVIFTSVTSAFQFFIGIGCLIFSDILSKGNKLKEDNDLTI